MKQIIQNYRTGELELAEVPAPLCSSNKILVKNVASLISIVTERSIIELRQKSLLGKAKARPDIVKRFMELSGIRCISFEKLDTFGLFFKMVKNSS